MVSLAFPGYTLWVVPLMIVDIAGGSRGRCRQACSRTTGRFSPDGASVLTSADGRIVVVDRDGEVQQRVAEDAFLFGPVWSGLLMGDGSLLHARRQDRSRTSSSAVRKYRPTASD